MTSPAPVLCPVCSAALAPAGRSCACPQRHNFDVSKEGYLSLLHGRGNYQGIGDDKLMVQARVRVHQLAPYRALAGAIASLCPPASAGRGVLDIGCGDGFFLHQVVRARVGTAPAVGVDISKEALARAAKDFPDLLFVRTDANQRLPFPDTSFSLVLSIFAPRPVEEIRRVLGGGGAWVIATAEPDHLKEIREYLPLAAIGAGKLDEPTSAGFAIRSSDRLTSQLAAARSDLISMVEMSPSIHRLRREQGELWKQRLPEDLVVTCSFSVTLLTLEPRCGVGSTRPQLI